MKKTKDNKANQWALFFDGVKVTITNNPSDFENLKGIIVPIDAHTAASAFELILGVHGHSQS